MKTYQCELCDNEGQDVQLAGTFTARLCLSHRRQWDRICTGHPSFIKMCKVGAALNAAIQKGDITQAMECADAYATAKHIMWLNAEEWLKEMGEQLYGGAT